MIGIKFNEKKIPATTLDLNKVSTITASLSALSITGEPNLNCLGRAVVVAQLVERLLTTPAIRGSNPNMGKILSTNCTIEKTKKDKEADNGPFLN